MHIYVSQLYTGVYGINTLVVHMLHTKVVYVPGNDSCGNL